MNLPLKDCYRFPAGAGPRSCTTRIELPHASAEESQERLVWPVNGSCTL